MIFAKKSALLAGMACMMAIPDMASAAEEELIEASMLIRSGISNGINEFGRIENALLDENGSAVEYLFFEVSETFNPTESGPGFVEIDNVEFNPVPATGRWDVVVVDTNAQRKPAELEVTHNEADHRLLSNLLDESIQFSDQQVRNIDDILIDPQTGQIEYFTVELDTSSFFDENIRAIPASEVQIGTAGKVSTSVSLSEVDSNSKYQLSAR